MKRQSKLCHGILTNRLINTEVSYFLFEYRVHLLLRVTYFSSTINSFLSFESKTKFLRYNIHIPPPPPGPSKEHPLPTQVVVHTTLRSYTILVLLPVVLLDVKSFTGLEFYVTKMT